MTAFMNFEGPTFVMKAPTDWLVTASPKIQALFVAVKEGNGKDIKPNLSVSIRRLEKGITLKALADSSRETQQERYPQYEVLQEREATEGDLYHFRRRYKWFKDEDASGIIQDQAFYLYGQALYTITATRSDSNDFNHIDEIFDAMIGSFRLVGTPGYQAS
ncbi:MAG: hypothetical protein B6242_13400 [Anaerolineaceae bacterium 4572_78]|nr:MAG: hypothetical protein B6242_13400 [Anaerolineaceae bacterium 4572_78]